MAIIEHSILGGMDLDSPDFVIPAGWYREARNVILRGNKGNMRLESQWGMAVLPNPLLPSTGTNKNIGLFYDAVNQRIFSFNSNTAGKDGIYIYNTVPGSFQRLIESGINTDGNILNFNPDVYVTSINIIYGDGNAGDLLFFVDSLLRPTKINIQRYLASTYTPVERDYIDVAKAPPVMPIQCTYENDTTVTTNNTLDALFQFGETFIYDDNEESVLSSGSITPLPAIVFSPTSNVDVSKSARISLYMQTGDVTVKKIRIYGRQTKDGVQSPWFIINTLEKSFFSIPSNSIYRYQFFNDGLYITADPKFTVLLQDYVPQQANCQALLNGNTVSYAGIVEGYDYIKSSYSIVSNNNPPPRWTVNGTLFFAFQPTGSNQITFYLTGVGTNDGTTGLPTTLDQPPNLLEVRGKVATTEHDFSFSPIDTSIPNILAGLAAAAVVSGYTVITTTPNSVTVSLANVVLQSSYVLSVNSRSTYIQQNFAYYPFSAYSFGVVFFDSKGRTNGVINDVTANVTTLDYETDTINDFTISLSGIVPPLWAKYYHLVRTNTLTYQKHLYWISNAAFSLTGQFIANQYAYVGISNIKDYNEQILATENVVSYEFTPGDRIRFINRYSVNGTISPVGVFDYAILGTVVNPMLNGIQQTGTFIQISYPTNDISSAFKFDGTPDYQNYFILIYSLTKHEPAVGDTNSNIYYEIGQQYGIGFPGTAQAYLMGNTGDNQIQISDGDIFHRKRTVPTGATYYLPAGNYSFGNQYTTFVVNNNNAAFDTTTSSYVVGHQSNTEVPGNNTPSIIGADYPLFADPYLFYNSSANPISIRVRGAYTLNLHAALGSTTSSGIYIKLVNVSGTFQILKLTAEQKVLNIETPYDYDFDGTFIVPAAYKAFIIVSNLGVAPDFAGVVNLAIGQFTLRLDVINNYTVDVFDPSFSDVYNLVTNSDSRVEVTDRTALQTYYGTLFRFSEPYQLGTNINNSNRFYPNNFDEFDKSFGSVQRMLVDKRQVKIFQNRKVGFINVYAKFIKDNNGTNTLVTTDDIITPNNIEYYDGDWGIGTQRTAVCHNGYQFYFFDPIKGYLIRLSGDGNIAISELYKVQTFAGNTLTKYNSNYAYPYGGNAKLIAVYNFLEDRDSEMLFIMQPGTSSAGTLTAQTLSFVERNNTFPAFYDEAPDNAICAENQLYLWINGVMYWQNPTSTPCLYFGQQFKPSITIVFNDFSELKKTWIAVATNSNNIWNCPAVTTQLNSFGQTPQSSQLIDADFALLEGTYQASFLRDINSPGGILNGDTLKGTYIIVKFTVTDGSKFSYLIAPSIKYIISQLTNK